MHIQACRSEFEANFSGFSCAKVNSKASKMQEACRFPVIKMMSYALAVLVVLAVVKPFIF